MTLYDTFTSYESKYTDIIESGLQSRNALRAGLQAVSDVNIDTFNSMSDGTSTKANLTGQMKIALAGVLSKAQSENMMREPFLRLKDYIEQESGKDLDTFLTDNSIQVSATFASLMNYYSITISAANIK